jgi:hypothetical protein
VYEGELRNDEYHGRGIFFTIAGPKSSFLISDYMEVPKVLPYIKGAWTKLVKGEFKNGKLEGEGEEVEICDYCYGKNHISKHNGSFKEWFLDGKGTMTGDGFIETGTFKRGALEGYGVQTFSNGNKYEGNWKQGLKHGHGAFFFSDGSKFDGEWNGEMNPKQGEITYVNGDKFIGQFSSKAETNDKDDNTDEFRGTSFFMVNHGILTKRDGSKYEGDFKFNKTLRSLLNRSDTLYLGRRDGYGVLTDSDGGRYEGYWKEDKKHGEGKLFNSKGKLKRDGFWENDEYVGKKAPGTK